jgi:hypothetical protein
LGYCHCCFGEMSQVLAVLSPDRPCYAPKQSEDYTNIIHTLITGFIKQRRKSEIRIFPKHILVMQSRHVASSILYDQKCFANPLSTNNETDLWT